MSDVESNKYAVRSPLGMSYTEEEFEAAKRLDLAYGTIERPKGDIFDKAYLDDLERIKRDIEIVIPACKRETSNLNRFSQNKAEDERNVFEEDWSKTMSYDKDSLIDFLLEQDLIAGIDWLGTGSRYPTEDEIMAKVGELADSLIAYMLTYQIGELK